MKHWYRFVVRVRVKHTMGTGFAGTGVGWTLLTHAIPMCHLVVLCQGDRQIGWWAVRDGRD